MATRKAPTKTTKKGATPKTKKSAPTKRTGRKLTAEEQKAKAQRLPISHAKSSSSERYKNGKYANINIRMTLEMKDQLCAIADESSRTLSNLGFLIIKDYLDKQEKAIA